MTETPPISARRSASASLPLSADAADLADRWIDARAFMAWGMGCTTAGGLVAALSRPLALELGP